MYQLSEAQRQELREANGVLRDSTVERLVEDWLDAAHADGCRETGERAAQRVKDARKRMEHVGTEIFLPRSSWQVKCEAELDMAVEDIRALAPSQVKEAPTIVPLPNAEIDDALGVPRDWRRPPQPSDVQELIRHRPIPVQPSDAAEREIEKLRQALAPLVAYFRENVVIVNEHGYSIRTQLILHDYDVAEAALRSTERKA